MNLDVTGVALVSECCTSYRTLYVVIVACKWTTPPEAVHVLSCCVFLAELELIPFNLELTFTLISPLCVRTSHTPSLTHGISHTLATDRVILLTSMRHHSQGITL